MFVYLTIYDTLYNYDIKKNNKKKKSISNTILILTTMLHTWIFKSDVPIDVIHYFVIKVNHNYFSLHSNCHLQPLCSSHRLVQIIISKHGCFCQMQVCMYL